MIIGERAPHAQGFHEISDHSYFSSNNSAIAKNNPHPGPTGSHSCFTTPVAKNNLDLSQAGKK